MRIGLIRERKKPADTRVALNPSQAAALNSDPSGYYEVLVEHSPDRIFPDEAYIKLGVRMADKAEGCDVLLGIKEVPAEELMPGNTYMFFSHTIKKQPYNQVMFQTMAKKEITLIDYECLNWPGGGRILGFGRWAGIVGTYNGLLTWGRKTGAFQLKPAYNCKGLVDLLNQLEHIDLPDIKIALTGEGRVGHGALEILEHLGIRRISPGELANNFKEPVYAVFGNRDIYRRKDGAPWESSHFYKNHGDYEGVFQSYLPNIDLLINGFYWEKDMAPLFSKEDTRSPQLRVKVIADITCDIDGSVPVTVRSTSIDAPTFGWDPVNQCETKPFQEGTIEVMAVPNLPSELPASASEDFGSALIKDILPLFSNDPEGILKEATILDKGSLTERYSYLSDYLAGN